MGVLVIVAISGGSVAILVLVCACACWRRRRMLANKAHKAESIKIRIDLWSKDTKKEGSLLPNRKTSMAGPLAEALGEGTEKVPQALQRIRSLRMRHTTTPDAKQSKANPHGSPDDEAFADLDNELELEFDILRGHMANRAKEKENLPRLQTLRMQVQRSDALLMAAKNRELLLRGTDRFEDLPAGHDLRTFDPDSFANRSLVTQQACIHANAARRRAARRLFAAENGAQTPLDEKTLDPITGVIQRAALTGGRLHAGDLASQSARTDANDGETNPDKWLLSAMRSEIHDSAEIAESPAVKSRLGRAREARSVSPRSDRHVVRRTGAPLSLDASPATTPKKPRSLFEIRQARENSREPGSMPGSPRGAGSIPGSPRGEDAGPLDPLTNALHEAHVMGIAPPPPPTIGQTDLVTIARDAPERVRRAREDHETRGRTPTRQRDMKRSASSAQALILASDESRLARQASDSTSPREREMKRSASSAHALKLASDERRAAMPTTPTRESLHWLDDAALPKKNNSRLSPPPQASTSSETTSGTSPPADNSPEAADSDMSLDDSSPVPVSTTSLANAPLPPISPKGLPGGDMFGLD